MNKLLFNGHEIVVKTEKKQYNGKIFRTLVSRESYKINRIKKFILRQTRTIMGRKEIFPQTRISVILCIESWDGVCILS